MRQCIVFVFGLLVPLSWVSGANVLVIVVNGPHSHQRPIVPLVNALASKGHNVTFATSLWISDAHPNITQLIIPSWQTTNDSFVQVVQNFVQLLEKGSAFTRTTALLDYQILFNSWTLKTPEYIAFLKNPPKADVIFIQCIVEETALVLSHTLKAPVIFFDSGELLPFISWDLNIPNPFSYIPMMISGYSAPMSFWERFMNTICNMILIANHRLRVMPYLDKEFQKLFPDSPSYHDLETNVAMLFINSNPVINGPRPVMPNVLEMGGIHIAQPLPLNKEFQEIVNAKDGKGFIVFTMGSYLELHFLPEEVQNRIFKVLARLDRTVIMKWTSEPFPKVPTNVRLFRWLPQLDLLAHPNCSLFISHCGMLGMLESLSQGVPMVGLPLFYDQHANAARVEHLGAGRRCDLKWDSEEQIYAVIQNVLNNPEYKNSAMKVRKAFYDSPMRPLDAAVFWTEYVIRNKGAPMLQSAAKRVPLYHYFLLDVICALAFMTFTPIVIIVLVTKSLFRKVRDSFTLMEIKEKKS